jgi:dUTP pyrophosphatase
MSVSEKSSGLESALRVWRDRRAKKFDLLHVSKPGDAGFNLVCVETTVIPCGLIPPTDVPTGIRVKLPAGTFGRIEERSGFYSRYPTLELCSSPIDNGYTGPLGPRFRNHGPEEVIIPAGESLAQLVLYPLIVPVVVEVGKLPRTARGAKRYGSTGK